MTYYKCRRCKCDIEAYDGYEAMFEDRPPMKVADLTLDGHILTCPFCGFARHIPIGGGLR